MKSNLPEAIKNQWVATLRSGKYPQGVGALATDDDRHCCLGVLCEILPGVTSTVDARTGKSEFRYDDPYPAINYLPRGIATKYFHGQDNPRIELWDDLTFRNSTLTSTTTLANLNDDGFTFKQIADVIDYFL